MKRWVDHSTDTMESSIRNFRAPWSTGLKAITCGIAILCVVLSVLLGPIGATIAWLSFAASAAFMIRGYSVAGNQLFIHRLGWAKTFDLSDLTDVDDTPNAMVGSIRTFGNGGLFGYIGHFSNATLGSYRAYATDPARTVVMSFGTKKLVLTPDRPAEFVAAVKQSDKQAG